MSEPRVVRTSRSAEVVRTFRSAISQASDLYCDRQVVDFGAVALGVHLAVFRRMFDDNPLLNSDLLDIRNRRIRVAFGLPFMAA